MKKKELKNGMLVELRNGDRCIILNGDIVCYNYNVSLYDIDSVLMFSDYWLSHPEFDIVAVYPIIRELSDLDYYQAPIWYRED